MNKMKKYICIDIGGTKIKHGVLTENLEFIEKGSVDTEAQKGGVGIMEKVCLITEQYLREHTASGVCISTAGMVDCDRGVITYSAPLIPDYIGPEIKKTVEDKFNLPCEVENDVNCACLAEYFYGAASGSSSCLCLTVGTGIGGAFICDGKIHHGFSGSGCEVGYMHLPGGEFQDLAAVSVLVRKTEKLKNVPEGSLNGKIIFELAKSGDEICIKTIDEMCDYLGMGVADICYVLNPETVVLGGGIMSETDYLSDRIKKALGKYLLPSVFEKTTLKFAENKNDAGMLGAYCHFRSMQA